jgi:hypothetical protein
VRFFAPLHLEGSEFHCKWRLQATDQFFSLFLVERGCIIDDVSAGLLSFLSPIPSDNAPSFFLQISVTFTHRL